MKDAEVQQENEAKQANPTLEQRRLDASRHAPDQRRAKKGLQRRVAPLDQAWFVDDSFNRAERRASVRLRVRL